MLGVIVGCTIRDSMATTVHSRLCFLFVARITSLSWFPECLAPVHSHLSSCNLSSLGTIACNTCKKTWTFVVWMYAPL